VPVLKETSRRVMKGMSWNVRLNLEAHGHFVMHFTNDEIIRKHRFIDTRHNQHLLRWDEGEQDKVNSFDIDYLGSGDIPDAVVISDYNKGFLTEDICCDIVKKYKSKNSNIPIFVDTKKTDVRCFEGCYIKINQKEFESLSHKSNNSKFIVTLGERGADYCGIIYSTSTVEVFDVCGAGDVFLSSLVSGYLNYGSIEQAIPFANKMASISVTHMGTYVLTEEDING
tara:strand:- start:1665 stop:2342 length:678 start_codon:yes stop_codon:yes gene_type:complete